MKTVQMCGEARASMQAVTCDGFSPLAEAVSHGLLSRWQGLPRHAKQELKRPI